MHTSQLIKSKLPCPDPSCGSSDAYAEYDDGHGYCFSCQKNFLTNGSSETTLSLSNTIAKEELKDSYTYQYLSWRKIDKESFRAYGSKFKIDSEGKPISIIFPYSSTSAKERKIDIKDFKWSGEANKASLFGIDKFSSGQAKAITITEGELDALSAYQMLGSKYPVVSVRSSSSARSDCEKAFDYLNAFEKIYLCFDNDEPGQRAVKEVSQLFDASKIYHVKLTKFKDANEYLVNGEEKEFTNIWWSSRPYLPRGLIADYQSIEEALRKEDGIAQATYPFSTLQEMTYGIRSKEIVLLLAQEKVGKTEVMRAIEYHLLKTTDDNIGIIHLEEEEKRSVQGLIGYELGVPCHLPDAGVSVEDQLEAYRRLTKRDGRVHYYSHFGSDSPETVLQIIRYLVSVCHCKYIFLDHITMLVTGYEGDDERKKLDFLSTRLAMMTRELDFTLFMVSHVNDDGKTRGSRNISKIADLIIALDRNLEADSYDERNKTRMTVRGNRYAGISGPAGCLVFDPKTFKLSELKIEETQVEFDPGVS
jgi:twinkle protein